MTTRTHLRNLARRALAAVAVAALVGAAACGESPTAPRAQQPTVAKQQPVRAGTARRGGYNVVAD